MTQLFPTGSSRRFANPDLSVTIPLETIDADPLFGILDFGHWGLFEICFLVLGICMIFIE
jgi:hypothetical protein